MTLAAALLAIIMMAILVQFLVDQVKKILPTVVMKYLQPPLIAAIIGIAIAIFYQIDLFEALGFGTQYALASWIFTGLILSSGSTAVHELIAKLRESRGGIDGSD